MVADPPVKRRGRVVWQEPSVPEPSTPEDQPTISHGANNSVPEPRTPEAALAEGPHRCDGSAEDEIAHVLAIPDGSPDDPGSMEYARWCVERLRLDGWSLVRTPTDGDLTAEREALIAEYHERMHEDGCGCDAAFIRGPLRAIESAARRTAPDDYHEDPCCFSIHEIEQTCPRTGRTWTGDPDATPCANCAHPGLDHDEDDWDCSVRGCDCAEYELPGLVARRTALTASPELTVERTLRAARFVAGYWRDAWMEQYGKGDHGAGLVTHPLAMVLAALDGETDPMHCGVEESRWGDFLAALQEPTEARS